MGTVNPDEACRLDFVGCQFDSECGGNQKCCKNVNCGYNQCQAPQVVSHTACTCGYELGDCNSRGGSKSDI